jgi:hypothetical protein
MISVRHGRMSALERVIEHISSDERAWITTRRAIADHFVKAVHRPDKTQ